MAIFCSAKHAASWLSVTPFIGLGFHLEPEEFHIAVKWWLGLDSSYGSQCAGSSLDPLGHYATTCKGAITAPQHLVCRVVPSLHINHMQMSIIEVFICRRLHMNILICIWLICRLGTALHTKCCGAVDAVCCHNKLRDILLESFHNTHAFISPSGSTDPSHQSRPADILVQDCDRGKPVAFDICVVSPMFCLQWEQQQGMQHQRQLS